MTYGNFLGENCRFRERTAEVGLEQEPAADVEARLEILDQSGTVLRTFTRKPEADSDEEQEEAEKDDAKDQILELKQGASSVVWDLRYPGPEKFSGMVIWNSFDEGPQAVPGHYQARMTVGEWSEQVELELVADPRSSATAEDFQAQFDFLTTVRDKLTETHKAIGKIRDSRSQIEALEKRLGDSEAHQAVAEATATLKEKVEDVEKALYQTQNRSRQDPLNFPIRLNDKLSGLYGSASGGDYGPTEGARRVKEQLSTAIDEQLAILDRIWAEDLPALNAQVKSADVVAIHLEESSEE